jgi:4-hydroxy-2-oxoheptanedioate aldolase
VIGVGEHVVIEPDQADADQAGDDKDGNHQTHEVDAQRLDGEDRVEDYFQRANEEICLIVQVETKRGLEELDAIAAVDGVDAVFVGPADLAATLGHLGNPGHPDVQMAIANALRRIQSAGKAAGCLSADEKLARGFIAAGCRFVAVGTDTVLLATATRALAAKYQGISAPAAPVGGQVY